MQLIESDQSIIYLDKKERRRNYAKKYRQSEKGKAIIKAYRESTKYKNYMMSDARKAQLKAYNESEKGKCYHKQYRSKPENKEKHKRYIQSEKYKEWGKKYREREDVKARIRNNRNSGKERVWQNKYRGTKKGKLVRKEGSALRYFCLNEKIKNAPIAVKKICAIKRAINKNILSEEIINKISKGETYAAYI